MDKAAAEYISPATAPEDRELALAVINNWRSSHGFPLNTMQVSLRTRARQHDPDALVAQRIKRLPSIRSKIERFPNMSLSRMQDIGGCRAVLQSVDEVQALFQQYQKGNGRHTLLRCDDYLFQQPKDSGYRGIHLVYSYRSDRKATYNGLRIELQLRSRLQHAWATAVETVGTFTQQALKSSQGADDWLRFFALMSSELAFREGTPLVPGTGPDRPAVIKELKRTAKRLDVVRRLNAYGATLRFVERQTGQSSRYFVLELNGETGELRLWAYSDLAQATEAYGAIERSSESDPNLDVVLVSVESLALLRRAYPNYFLDTTVFLEALEEALV
ncbi:RelA/SpoT domain-containing protein [Blastococcus sp. SYSU D01042]